MALYKIEWKRSATKELRQIPKDAIQKALSIVETLTSNPHPNTSKKLSGTTKTSIETFLKSPCTPRVSHPILT